MTRPSSANERVKFLIFGAGGGRSNPCFDQQLIIYTRRQVPRIFSHSTRQRHASQSRVEYCPLRLVTRRWFAASRVTSRSVPKRVVRSDFLERLKANKTEPLAPADEIESEEEELHEAASRIGGKEDLNVSGANKGERPTIRLVESSESSAVEEPASEQLHASNKTRDDSAEGRNAFDYQSCSASKREAYQKSEALSFPAPVTGLFAGWTMADRAKLMKRLAIAIVMSLLGLWFRKRSQENQKYEKEFTDLMVSKSADRAIDEGDADSIPDRITSMEEASSNKGNLEPPRDTFLPSVNDDAFEAVDNLCIFWVDSIDELESRRAAVEKFTEDVKTLDLPFNLTFMYSARTEALNDPVVTFSELHVALYKGQRKFHFVADTSYPKTSLEHEEQMNKVKKFLAPRSEEDWTSEGATATAHLSERQSGNPVQSVTYRTFRKEVVEKSSPEHPIILQLMEDGCFLCFLIRPLINSISNILQEHKVPLTLKRFNLDRNDFPPECPVSRATPTFVEYRGLEGSEADKPDTPFTPPIPWKAFRPKEFAAALIKAYHMPEAAKNEITRVSELVQERFQKFGLLTIWSQEVANLQKFMSDQPKTERVKERPKLVGTKSSRRGRAADDSDQSDESYDEIVNDLMREDATRVDALDENLKYLESEIAALEQDAIAYAKMLGDKLNSPNAPNFDLVKSRMRVPPLTSEAQGLLEGASAKPSPTSS